MKKSSGFPPTLFLSMLVSISLISSFDKYFINAWVGVSH